MSEPGCASERVSLDDLALADARFAADPRFRARSHAPPEPDPEPDDALPEADPLEQAFAEGHAQGFAEATALAQAEAAQREAALQPLTLACARLDEAAQRVLAERLRDTVLALCETALAAAAIDPDVLLKRTAVAAAMLSRADDDRVIRLHPDDLALIAARLPADWTTAPDPALPRGAIRIEGRSGGVEDGPDQWRTALLEALETQPPC